VSSAMTGRPKLSLCRRVIWRRYRRQRRSEFLFSTRNGAKSQIGFWSGSINSPRPQRELLHKDDKCPYSHYSATVDSGMYVPSHRCNASFWGMKPMAEALIRRGAPMELHNKDKDSQLTMAVGGGEKELVALLLEHKAFVSHRNKWNSTPLLVQGDLERVENLLDHGVPLDVRDADKDTPLHITCARTCSCHLVLCACMCMCVFMCVCMSECMRTRTPAHVI